MAKILLIDDEQGMRQVISKILTPAGQGHIVLFADSGPEISAVCERETPELVLMDVRLPDMEGSDILAAVRKVRLDVPIIVLPGFIETDAAVALVRKGCFGYISKPFKIEDFVKLVNRALASRSKPVSAPSTSASLPQKPHPVAPSRKVSKTAGRPVRQNRISVKLPSLKIILPVISVGIIAAAIWFVIERPLSEAEFSVVYQNPSAIFCAGKNIFVSDWMAEEVYKHKNNRIVSVDSIYKVPGESPVGIAFDGKYLWTCNSFQQKISKHNVDKTLSVAATFNSPGPSPCGLLYDGKNIWSLDFQQAKIYKHKMDANLSVDQSYDSPTRNPKGIFKAGRYFYIADAETNRIFKLSDDSFSIHGIYNFQQDTDLKNHISGMGFDGKSVWICYDGMQKLFRRPLKSLKPVRI